MGEVWGEGVRVGGGFRGEEREHENAMHHEEREGLWWAVGMRGRTVLTLGSP